MTRLVIEAVGATCKECRDGFKKDHWCEDEAKALRAMLTSKNPKPTGYAWKLWHEDAPRAPKALPKGGVYPPWAWGTPNKLVAAILKAAVVPSGWHQRCLEHYAAGTHPWAPNGAPAAVQP